ncbi:photosynthetic complex putative assembly protein PuhB [Pseudotabrizicola sp. L79]|uniref:photosynthetic complex putative assembly protein PuhB n=1 Tax=Pseudotabrizicola sp. L79 TaxID=3118402 RepID=UPI002F923A0E
MSDRDFNFEYKPGLPAPLPAGEDILWQGKPDTATLAREAFKIRWITGYMLVLALWQGGSAYADGGAGYAIARLIPYLVLAVAAYGVVYGLAWMQARAAIYTITNARVILRVGAALPITYTLPFTCIETASLASDGIKGTGTLALQTKGNMRLSYAVLWPHVRPWHIRLPQPALRAIPDATQAARILADAAQAKINEPRISRTAPQDAGLVAAE